MFKPETTSFEAAYIKTFHTGLLDKKVQEAIRMLEKCSLCPRNCGANRLKGEKGYCKAVYLPEISSYNPHFGEENPLVGLRGSGTIFLTHCNLRCQFCQNFSISHLAEGRKVSFERLTEMMLELQRGGCHNINFVSPSHYVPQILKALSLAVKKGLDVPLVYNTGGYDSVETLKILEGVFDIYMPDFKFTGPDVARQFCNAPDYPQVAKAALKEMQRQVGDLILDDKGIALRGVLLRHLVLPEGLAGTEELMRFLSDEVSKNIYVNIMDQFYPCGEIPFLSPLNRRISRKEYTDAVEAAKKAGITRLDKRERFRVFWV